MIYIRSAQLNSRRMSDQTLTSCDERAPISLHATISTINYEKTSIYSSQNDDVLSCLCGQRFLADVDRKIAGTSDVLRR